MGRAVGLGLLLTPISSPCSTPRACEPPTCLSPMSRSGTTAASSQPKELAPSSSREEESPAARGTWKRRSGKGSGGGEPCAPHTPSSPPWQLLGQKSSCLTVDSSSGTKLWPAAPGSATAMPMVLSEDWRCFTPPCQLLHPHPICTSSGMFYATQGSLLQLPLTGAQSLGPQAAPQPLGEGSQQWSLHSRSNAVPTTSDPKPFPAPGVALSPHSGGSSCSPLTCSCSAWAEPVPCAPLAVSAWSQVQKL